MAPKRKIGDENRRFCEEWTEKYFFVEAKGGPLCLICRQSVSVTKEFNVKRHFESNHAREKALLPSEASLRLQQLRASLSQQQRVFQRAVDKNKSATKASYLVAKEIATHGKAFSDGEFIKKCMMLVAHEVCPQSPVISQIL